VQLVTGFAMFFLASIHLYQIGMEPHLIDPYGSADLVWSGGNWVLLLLLLLCVQIHGLIGLFRLALKWGWPRLGDAERTRRILRRAMWGLLVFFIGIGLLTLGAFIRIGKEHAPNAGELYIPSWVERGP
jgi:fumarate reductase subunit C